MFIEQLGRNFLVILANNGRLGPEDSFVAPLATVDQSSAPAPEILAAAPQPVAVPRQETGVPPADGPAG